MTRWPGLAGCVLVCLAGVAVAQDIKTMEDMKRELQAPPPRRSLLDQRAFAPQFKPDATTGRCTGLEQPGGLERRDLAVVPFSAEQPARVDVPFQFETDAYRLTPSDERQADEVARLLSDPAFSQRRFSITGHTDAEGAREHNLRLSCARALAVRDALVKRGIAVRRLGVFGFGFDRLAVPSDPRNARNRRVEIQNVDDYKP